MLKDILLAREGSMIAIVAWFTLILLSVLLYFLAIRPIWYKTTYSELIYDTGKITEKHHYITTSTTIVMSGKVMVPIINTYSHHDVTIECENITLKRDNREVYNKVTLHDKVKISYKEEYISPRFYDGEKEFDGYSLESVEVIN